VLTGTPNEIVVTDGGAGAAVTLSAGALIVQTDQANTWTTGIQTINTGAAGTVGLIVKGAAGQTADLQQWQDSTGAVLSGVDERGVLFSHGGIDVNSVYIGDGAGNTGHTNATKSVCIGKSAGAALTTGDHNVFIGYLAGNAATTAQRCVFIGRNAGGASVSGDSNVFVGDGAGQATTGNNNTFVGFSAGNATTTGNDNVFFGYLAGAGNTQGARNFFMGRQAGDANTTGSDNVFMGYSSGHVNTTGNGNIYIGRQAGNANDGSYNVLIGYEAGKDNAGIGSNKLYIANSNTTTPLIYGLFTGTGAGVTIHSQATDGIPLVVKGIASQTANLQDWQNSAGTALLEVEASGELDFRWAMGNSTKDPTTDAPADWVQVKIGGTSYYLPAYAAS
jgi:hypothetical protein